MDLEDLPDIPPDLLEPSGGLDLDDLVGQELFAGDDASYVSSASTQFKKESGAHTADFLALANAWDKREFRAGDRIIPTELACHPNTATPNGIVKHAVSAICAQLSHATRETAHTLICQGVVCGAFEDKQNGLMEHFFRMLSWRTDVNHVLFFELGIHRLTVWCLDGIMGGWLPWLGTGTKPRVPTSGSC